MVPLFLAGLLGAGIGGIVGYRFIGAIFRRRSARIADFPELPAPADREA